MRKWIVLLAIVAVASISIALSYPLFYHQAEESNNAVMNDLSTLRMNSLKAEQERGDMEIPPREAPSDDKEEVGTESEIADAEELPSAEQTPAREEVASKKTTDALEETSLESGVDGNGQKDQSVEEEKTALKEDPKIQADLLEEVAPEESESGEQSESAERQRTDMMDTAQKTEEPFAPSEASPSPTPRVPDIRELILDIDLRSLATMAPEQTFGARSANAVEAAPTPTPDRGIRTSALAYEYLEKRELDESLILPELKDIYEINHDLVGWLYIEDTVIDYPVVQSEDSEFYLKHDFYGNENVNGQIILDTRCDPYTPSYNLVISGHHMKNGSMFGDLPKYQDKGYWEKHRFFEWDTLMDRKKYVIFATFYSADYDEDEEGFRYNADIQYKLDAEQWLGEIRENQLFDTGVDVQFGDEFITLTTCYRVRHKNGRFVVVARRIREGEDFQ